MLGFTHFHEKQGRDDWLKRKPTSSLLSSFGLITQTGLNPQNISNDDMGSLPPTNGVGGKGKEKKWVYQKGLYQAPPPPVPFCKVQNNSHVQRKKMPT